MGQMDEQTEDGQMTRMESWLEGETDEWTDGRMDR